MAEEFFGSGFSQRRQSDDITVGIISRLDSKNLPVLASAPMRFNVVNPECEHATATSSIYLLEGKRTQRQNAQ